MAEWCSSGLCELVENGVSAGTQSGVSMVRTPGPSGEDAGGEMLASGSERTGDAGWPTTTAPRIWLNDMLLGTASSEAGGVGMGRVAVWRSSAISLGVAMREVNSNQNVAPSPVPSDRSSGRRTLLRLDAEPAAAELDDLLDDREAEAGSGRRRDASVESAGRCARCAPDGSLGERLEEPARGEVARTDAGPGVLDRDAPGQDTGQGVV